MQALIGELAAKHNAGPQRQLPLPSSLHCAVWNNQPECVRQLLEKGGNVDLQDGESGWTALHRAFYWGNYRCAAVLLAANAHLSLADFKGRTALDLLSEERKDFLEHQHTGVVYSWGNGANYQLGTGATGLQAGPVRLDALRKELVVQIAAAKFHSAAVTKDGRLFTWGFGRGGRLGHPDFHVHSGESAIIVPKAVTGLGRRQVAVVAVAKHHTAVATTSCELFTWGSNRDGRLGYAAVDTQPTPRKVTSLKQRVVAVAAASKHTAVLTDAGVIFSWGSNDQGQLGYGTSDSASNAMPRQVEAMKGKRLIAVAAAKRHMVVMSSEGDIYTWGHRVVTPRRVQLAGARDVQRTDGFTDIAFHKGQSEMSRPHAVAIAAGAAHSCCLTRTGVVLAWRSWDPNLSVQEVSASLAGKQVVSIAAGKYRTAAVTDEGDVYMWEGLSKQHPHRKKAAKDAALPPKPDKATSRRLSLSDVITPERVEGLKRVRKACVGEKHSLALHCWCPSPKQLRLPMLAAAAALPAADRLQSNADAEDFAELVAQAQEDAEWTAAADRSLGAAAVAASATGVAAPAGSDAPAGAGQGSADITEWLGRDFWVGLESAHQRIQAARAQAEANEYYQPEGLKAGSIPSLQRLCERSLAESAVEPRTCLQIMEYADACGAEVLKQFCLGIALANLDSVLLEARGVLEGISSHLLAEMEDVQKAQFEAASPMLEGANSILQRLLSRRPTAAPTYEGVEEGQQDDESSSHRRSSLAGQALVPSLSNTASELAKERSFCNPEDTEEAAAIGRQTRNLKKKLQQIEALEARQQGSQLDPQQQAKLAQKAEVCAVLAALHSGASLEETHKIAQSHRPSSMATLTPGSSVHRSPSVLSMDSATSRGKPGGGKHRPGVSRLSSRQDLSQAPSTQALDTGSSMTASDTPLPLIPPQRSAPQHLTELESDTPSALLDRPAQSCFPATQLSGPSCTTRPESVAALSSSLSSSAAASGSRVSAWGQAGTCPPAASLRVSGFSTPEKQKADVPAWATAVSGPSLSFGSAGGISTPSSSAPSAAARKVKPPRKGGLSMFLSGELEKAATPPAPPPPPPTTAADFSWGGAQASQPGAALTSLRDIQNQEAAVTQRPEVQRNSGQASSGLTSNLQSSRARPVKQEVKDRESRDHALELMFDCKRVPLEALVRRSSPIAVAAKEEEPAEPQGPAWGGIVLGASPPGPGADAGPQEASAKPRLSDIQAEQERVRDSCSRSFGAGGSSPGGDGFASLLHWRGGSGGTGAAAGSSPGGLFPSGSSPHTTRKIYTPSPQQNSKWYIKEERPVVALQDIQSEEFTRELQAQQEAAAAAAAKLQAEEAAVAAAAQKALKKKQRQQRQAKAKAAAQARQQQEVSAQAASATASQDDPATQAGQLCAAGDASFPDTAKVQSSDPGSQRGQVEPSLEPLQQDKPVNAGHSSINRSSNQHRSQHTRKPQGDSRRALSAQQPAVSHGKAPSRSELQRPSSDATGSAGSKPRVLEVRRPRRPTNVKQLGQHGAASSANIAADKAGTEETKPARQQRSSPSMTQGLPT